MSTLINHENHKLVVAPCFSLFPPLLTFHLKTDFSDYTQMYTVQCLVGPSYALTKSKIQTHMKAGALPRSPKCAASMWLGCFLRMAVRPRAKESMLAEMALMATWLGPAACWTAWWFPSPSDGEWGLGEAVGGGQKTGMRRQMKKRRLFLWRFSKGSFPEASRVMSVFERTGCSVLVWMWAECLLFSSLRLKKEMLVLVTVWQEIIKHYEPTVAESHLNHFCMRLILLHTHAKKKKKKCLRTSVMISSPLLALASDTLSGSLLLAAGRKTRVEM